MMKRPAGFLLRVATWSAFLLICGSSLLQVHAATYRGIYVLIDPYQSVPLPNSPSTDIQLLQQSAAPGYCGTNGTPNNAFLCKSVNGILLDIHWCNWETDSNSSTPGSCGVAIQDDAKVTVQLTEAITGCTSQQFDTCGAPTNPGSACAPNPPGTLGNPGVSTLGLALYYLCETNLNRIAVGLNPLKIELSLDAGVYTPTSVISSTGYIDLPLTPDTGGMTAPKHAYCGRQPWVWPAYYAKEYDLAFDALINYVVLLDQPYSQSATSTTSPITIVKVSGINENTLETVQSGSLSVPMISGSPVTFLNPPAGDPTCTYGNSPTSTPAGTSTGPAAWWLQTYNGHPLSSDLFIQAMEHAFGRIMGHEYATVTQLAAAPNSVIQNPFVFSVSERNGQSMPDIDCGPTGTGSINSPPPPAMPVCQTQLPQNMTGGKPDQWTIWYFARFIKDLFPNGSGNYPPQTSGAAAAAEVTTATGGTLTYNLLAANLATETTNLQQPATGSGCTDTDCPAVATAEMPCNLNNTASTPQVDWGTEQLNGVSTQFSGAGTSIAWQTAQGDYYDCSTAGSYANDLGFGIANGGQFIEISSPEADQYYCQGPLASQLLNILHQTLTTCNYTNP